MGKINSLFLRKSRGKLAGTTLYTTSGVTIQRELPGTIKNPRTKRQMTQRCKLANLVNMYKAGKSFFASAFENKKPLVSDYNMFVGRNLAANPVMLPKQYAAAGAFFAVPYQITAGSLHDAVTDTGTDGAAVLNLDLGSFDSISENTTVGAFSAALLNNNPWLREGDQISLVIFSGLLYADPDTNSYSAFRKFEVLLASGSTEKLLDYIPAISVEDAHVVYPTDPFGEAAAWVVSRTDSGKTSVTTETLVWSDPSDAVFATDAWKQAAIDSYGESKEVFLNSEEAHKA